MTTMMHKNLHLMVTYLLDACPDGISTGDLARQLKVTDETIRNYLKELHTMGIPVTGDKSPYYIDPKNHKHTLEFSLEEAWYVYLPMRRVVRAQQAHTSIGQRVIQRLGNSINHILGEHLATIQSPQPQKTAIFETLVQGWSRRQVIRIRYEPLDKEPTHLVIAPFWFEPAVWTDSTYCIAGIGKQFERRIVLKLDRIVSATLLEDHFQRPTYRELLKQIEGSWGIWTSDDPVKVQLRFSNRVIQRVQETRWHPSEEMLLDAEGRLLWIATIDEPKEMMPWIRSWGADVEVLTPDSLRQHLAREIRRMADLYEDTKKPKSFF